MELIRVSDVQKTYKTGTVALYDFNLSIKKGEFVFVIGASGSGKSTLIKMLYREEKPDKGSIIIGGINVAKLKNRKVYVLRRKLGVVFQDFKLLPKLTVYENVAFAMEVLGYDKKEIRKRVLEVLDLVGLKNKVRQYPDQLSGGEQQRVVIARAIVNKPKLLICDEPTSALDPVGRKEILDILFAIRDQTTVLFSTHILSDVERVCTDIAFLNDGIICLEGKLSDIKEGYRTEEYLIELEKGDDIQLLLNTFQDCRRNNENGIIVQKSGKEFFEVMQFVTENKLSILKIERLEPSLESLFLEVVQG